jgi:hypothetical protein
MAEHPVDTVWKDVSPHFPSVLTVSETTVAVIDDAFGRQGNTCQSGNSVVTFDARKS